MTPLPDPLAEARRVVDRARAIGVRGRVVGGVGIAVGGPSAAEAPVRRAYADIDLVGRGPLRGALTELLSGLGYEPAEMFNTLQGARRLLFWDGTNGRQLDVFVDRFSM